MPYRSARSVVRVLYVCGILVVGSLTSRSTSTAHATDLDIHFTQPGGSWFDMSGGDCYFQTTNPDWGPAGPDGVSGNDPRLEVDNVVGFGPEIIGMDQLWDGGPFTLGAHYWADHGGGAAIARERAKLAASRRHSPGRRATIPATTRPAAA